MVELLSYLPRLEFAIGYSFNIVTLLQLAKTFPVFSNVTSELNSEQMKQSSINQVDKIPASVNVRRVLLHRRMCTNNQERIQG
ncbi:hypothetical protein NECAME_13497 [Necator americanus]|uniref:Uncharacterized protein n=1 Tax=Necator americanus TaxID=51031 RepID=W2SVH0_NECAM|nr:hypothetical protein NECAME_13497 [Necator americanus]ETN73523.1 hypothetical protein NECAME_13497 [Necator americanus]